MGQSLDGHSFSICFELCHCNSVHGNFILEAKQWSGSGGELNWKVYYLFVINLFFDHFICAQNIS